MKVVLPKIKQNWNEEEKDAFLNEIKDIYWVMNCAMGLIENSYKDDSVRFQEMKKITNDVIEDLKKILIESKVTGYDVCYHNLDWMWEDRINAMNELFQD